MARLIALLLLVLGCASPLLACKAACIPDQYTVRSPNGQYRLEINRKEGVQTVYREKQAAALWQLRRPPAGQEFFLSNDGTTVAEIVRASREPIEADARGIVLWRKAGAYARFGIAEIDGISGRLCAPWDAQVRQEQNVLVVRNSAGVATRIDLGDAKILSRTDTEKCGTQEADLACRDQTCLPMGVYCNGREKMQRERLDDIDLALILGIALLLGTGLIHDIHRRVRARTGAALWRSSPLLWRRIEE
jgi:hypothetical protein